jgi:acetyl-CoA carboxylase biotin carboxylase subunit
VDTPFEKVLVANRGEIAVRVMRTLREIGITAVAVYSDADREAHHVRFADEAHHIGGAPSAESYLRIDKLIEVARTSGATAIHPGYGFLSENAEFAAACEQAGITFIGPPSGVIASLGDKLRARECAERAGAPTVPGVGELPEDPDAAVALAEPIGYPIMIKATGGGGGKGMRVAHDREALVSALELTRGEALAAFSSSTLFAERFVERPRHVEMQVIADTHGNTVWLGERECSIQRRHQKLIEETPSPAVDDALRERMGEAAVSIMREAGYVGAGTVEFLLDQTGEFYFLEVNARLQVEHPVTEWVTGLDLVREQLRVAGGGELPFTQDEVIRTGWSIECRITAEDPDTGFLPSTGRVTDLRLPEGPFVRSDFGVLPGSDVPIHYDPMLGKLTAWGRNREDARLRLLRCLQEFRLSGVTTNTPFHLWALNHDAFIAGDLSTAFIEEHFKPEMLVSDDRFIRGALVAAALQYYDDRRRIREPKHAAGAGSAWRWGGRTWK